MEKNYKTSSSLFSDLTEAEIKSSLFKGAIAAEFIKQRRERKLTQKEFADLLDVTQGMISKWESLNYNITVSSLIEIFSKLDVDVDIRFNGKSLLNSKNKSATLYQLFIRNTSDWQIDNKISENKKVGGAA